MIIVTLVLIGLVLLVSADSTTDESDRRSH